MRNCALGQDEVTPVCFLGARSPEIHNVETVLGMHYGAGRQNDYGSIGKSTYIL